MDEPALLACALVAARYGDEVAPLGVLGVIGPSRMDYSRVIPLVAFCSRAITEKLLAMSSVRDETHEEDRDLEGEGGSIPIDPELEAALREAVAAVEEPQAAAQARADHGPPLLDAEPVPEGEAEAVASRLREELADAARSPAAPAGRLRELPQARAARPPGGAPVRLPESRQGPAVGGR